MMKKIFLLLACIISINASSQHKLEILDFWATWCGSCIKEFPKLVNLQKEFGNNLKVTLINSKSTEDDKKKILAFRQQWEQKNGKLNVAMVSEDEQLEKKYPHKSIPHCVWLLDGALLAVTGPGEVTRENISALINGKNITLSPKIEFDDPDRPLYLSDFVPAQMVSGYSIFLKGEKAGLDRGYQWRKDHADSIIGIKTFNMNLFDAYRSIAADYRLYMRNKNRLIVNLQDSDSLRFTSKDSLICFEYMSSGGRTNYQQLLTALNAFTGLNVQIKTMKTDCLVLTRDEGGDVLSKKAEPTSDSVTKNRSLITFNDMDMLVGMLNGNSVISLPVIDETNNSGKINIVFRIEDIKNLERLDTVLKKNGLQLQPATRELEMVVVQKQ